VARSAFNSARRRGGSRRSSEDCRTFRVDRIDSVSVRGHTFIPRQFRDAARFVAEGITTAPHAHRAIVLLEADLAEVARRIPPSAGVLTAIGDRTRLELGFDELDWIAGYLVGVGFAFEVAEPKELRRHIGNLAGRLAGAPGPTAV
jgi:predicted DNA-binding transcriptional regulator YafY